MASDSRSSGRALPGRAAPPSSDGPASSTRPRLPISSVQSHVPAVGREAAIPRMRPRAWIHASSSRRSGSLLHPFLERVILDRQCPRRAVQPVLAGHLYCRRPKRIWESASGPYVFFATRSNRRRTPSRGAGRSRVFLAFIDRPPQNREPTINDTTRLTTIHARLPERHCSASRRTTGRLIWTVWRRMHGCGEM